MRNSDSSHKCWVQTLSHFADVNQRMEEGVKKHCPLHRELAKTRMKRDAEATALFSNGLMKPTPLTMIVTRVCSYHSPQDSQALQVMG